MNLLYSETIKIFLKKIITQTQMILRNEMYLECSKNHFWFEGMSYYFCFAVFEHPTQMGYFKEDFWEIGINKCFLFESDETIRDLLRHELAHYIAFILYGYSVSPHGKEFHNICSSYGWKKEVAKATTSLTKKKTNQRILQKIQKLFALSSSHHANEAQSALLKAHELLLKYQVDEVANDQEEMEIHRLFKEKRKSSKMEAIASILEHFCVYPVFNYANHCVYLEIFGHRLNVEIATYIGHFLYKELDKLWKNSKLKGLRAKNSFFRGIARGYEEKMKPPANQEKALISLNNQLTQSAAKAYPRLFNISSKARVDSSAIKMGKEKGRNLQIRSALKEKNSTMSGLLTY